MKNPEKSEGARIERAAIRSYLRRQIRKWYESGAEGREAATLEAVLAWVLDRQKRYDKKVGGLGKK